MSPRVVIEIDLPEQEPDTTNMDALSSVLHALAASADTMDSHHGGELIDWGYAGGDHGESVQVTLATPRPVDSLGLPERIGGSDALDHIAYTLAEHRVGKRDKTDTIALIDEFATRAGRVTS